MVARIERSEIRDCLLGAGPGFRRAHPGYACWKDDIGYTLGARPMKCRPCFVAGNPDVAPLHPGLLREFWNDSPASWRQCWRSEGESRAVANRRRPAAVLFAD
jgi:hypothetical protein